MQKKLHISAALLATLTCAAASIQAADARPSMKTSKSTNTISAADRASLEKAYILRHEAETILAPYRLGSPRTAIPEAEFRRAEALMLQAQALFDRSPLSGGGGGIEERRWLIRWYRGCSKPDLAENQTRILERQLGTKDADKLFPIAHCPTCGRG